jgi:hypothetical protein
MSLNGLVSDLPPAGGRAFGTPAPNEASNTDRAWEVLTRFIPTEILAPYVTGLSLAPAQAWDPTVVYIGFIIATPIVFFLFQLAKAATSGKPWPALLPLIWRAITATAAFSVWGLSVPSNPLQAVIGGALVAGFLALIVSPVLAALDAIVLKVLGVQVQ